jgi:hypothetical protein
MKSLSSLQDFFYENIYPDLSYLELKRVRIFTFLKRSALFLLIIDVILFISLLDVFPNAIDLAAICIAGSVGVFILLYKHKMKEFVIDYKDQIIEKLVTFVDESLHYSKDGTISKYEYDSSALFHSHVDKFKGEDKIEGTIEGVDIKFSELHTQQKKKNAKGQEYYATIFRGLFFIADFNKHFKGKTIILPDKSEKYFGFISHFFQSFSSHGELVKLDNSEFEKEFVVYSNDQIEARYILATSFMENILKLKKIANKKISISFNGAKVYIAIHLQGGVFEPKIYKKVSSFDEIKSYFETISLIVLIVKTLNLDVKIWSKK